MIYFESPHHFEIVHPDSNTISPFHRVCLPKKSLISTRVQHMGILWNFSMQGIIPDILHRMKSASHSIILARVYQGGETPVTSARTFQGGETSVISAWVYQGDETSIISTWVYHEDETPGISALGYQRDETPVTLAQAYQGDETSIIRHTCIKEMRHRSSWHGSIRRTERQVVRRF